MTDTVTTESELRSRIRSCDKLRELLEDVLDDSKRHTVSVSALGLNTPHVQSLLESLSQFRHSLLETLDDVVEDVCETHAQLSTIRRTEMEQ